jgi:hypothetical protein
MVWLCADLSGVFAIAVYPAMPIVLVNVKEG